MKIKPFALLLSLLLPAFPVPSAAQDVGRVSPAMLPLPLPATTPLPPDVLRSRNPWTLPMTGNWRFALTQGRIDADKRYIPDAGGSSGISASSSEQANPPINAFDGSATSRWCANGGSVPQWLEADLGKMQQVTGVTLTWEKPNDRYRFLLEGSADGKKWRTLANASAEPGVGDGPVSLTPAEVRFVRVTVLGVSGTDWASIRECEINVSENGQTRVWAPPAPKVEPAETSATFAAVAFDDTKWDNLAVPSNWEMAGYSPPTYDAVDNTVGQYRRWVTVPAAWAGRKIYWHFDGALDGAEVFINGQKAGYHESGYTAWDIDLTGLVQTGKRNLFAVRVSKTTPSDDCETGDFQAMGGIYRDTFLIAAPQTHIHDITIQTSLSSDYKDAALDAAVQVQGTAGETVEVTGKLFGGDGKPTAIQMTGQGQVGADGGATIALTTPVSAPKLWSAEKPNLYYVVFEIKQGGITVERVEQRFGFKQIEIKNNIILWNGQPIKCEGVCRHDFWADKGFALTEKEWAKDLSLMKAANINSIRTSHYNHAARFLELCDEKGFYILDEVPYCWINDQVKDPAYAPFLLQRAAETLARDKNRPCVLAWSLGNENPSGPDSQDVIDLVKKTDPTRPAFVSSVNPNDIKGQAWEDDHYPDPNSVDRIARNTRWPANFSEHPHIFYQKETQDYDPGASDLWSEAMIRTWDKLWKAPTILGSFVWEWQNQGIADKYPDKTRDLWYGPDHMRQENNKGIVDAYRNPKPEWWIVKNVYSPVVVAGRTVSPNNGTALVSLTNHYSFTDLKELNCRWTARSAGKTLQTGILPVACPPGQSVQATFPAPAGMTTLRLEFDNADGTEVVAANLTVDSVALPAPPAALAAGAAPILENGQDTLRISSPAQEVIFDKHTGAVSLWRVHGKTILTGGPILNLGEAKGGSERGYYRAAQPPVLADAKITMTPGTNGSVQMTVTSGVSTAGNGTALGTLTCVYDIKPTAEITVNWKMDWTAPNINLWEAGLKFTVPAGITEMKWQRDSFFTDYPAGHIGAPSGTVRTSDAQFHATKRGLHWLALTDKGGAGLALLPSETMPLTGRAEPGTAGMTFFASREVAPPRDFSGNWMPEHEIHAVKGKSLSGAFTLRALAP